MTKNDFLRMASIHVCAALVKCYDETKISGIIDHRGNQKEMVQNAIDIAEELHNQASAKGWFNDKLFTDEPEEKAK